jgi:hypothetical protein
MSKVTDAVHAKGSFMYSQLWALGRAASAEQLKREDPSFDYVGAGDVPLPRKPQQQQRENGDEAQRPRALTKPEIAEYVWLYATAACNAIERAGFDGVEIYGATSLIRFSKRRRTTARTSMAVLQKTTHASYSTWSWLYLQPLARGALASGCPHGLLL